jgi:hypothetical protein
MALKLSTDLRNKMLGMVGIVKAIASEGITSGNMAFVDGGAGEDTITDSGNGFVTAGFSPGDLIYIRGATTAGNNLSGVELTAVAAGTLTMATGTVAAAEDFPATAHIVACKGGSLKDVFKDGILKIYSGSQPTNADTAASGTLLVSITLSSGAHVAGAFGNGLEFGTAASGAISKASGATWSGAAVASGTAGWFRLYANATDAGGASTSLPRIDGSVGTSGADLNMSSTTITSGQTYTIDTFTITLPSYYGA